MSLHKFTLISQNQTTLKRMSTISKIVKDKNSIQLTLRAYEMDKPTIPAVRESLAITANRQAKNMIQLPTNSSRMANHL